MATEALERIREENTAHAEYRVRRRFVQQRDNKDYVTYPGLLDLAHQVSEGRFEIATTLVQVPNQDNGMVAICTATAILFDTAPEGVELRRTSGIGDASPQNVNRAMAPHLIRMAETRAKARALRDLCAVAMVAFEELGPAGVEDQPDPAERQPEGIEYEGRWFVRPQVVAGYQRWLTAARQRGLSVPPGDVLAEDAPLDRLLEVGQELRRRVEAAPASVGA